jgi:radical SAM superfamily enzyme YgiQ (UPF0313 family)
MKICNVSNPVSFERQEIHPLGSDAKVLLTGIFGPFAQDDEYGSRTINPAEFHHNQVTRVQGPYSLRMFHRNGGLKLIQANINAPCTLLEYPDLDRFILELQNKKYDIIGISAIQPNLKKVEKMCALIREHQSGATIIVGGHIANMTDLDIRIDADYVVRGEGVRWFRKFLGEDQDSPINHPHIPSGINRRCMGINLSKSKGEQTAVLMPSAGCPVGCNFCSTSAMFGGKGKFVSFYKTGDELFDIMCQLEEQMGVCSFFVMDENFLLYRKRALRLLELMQRHGKDWALHVFASADVLISYTIEQLVGLGISWVWIGLEGRNNRYRKLKEIDTRSMVRKLQANGIRILGSTIIGLEEHTPENIDEEIEWAVSHETEFHQFMLYTAPQGTPLYEELKEKGMLLDESEIELADVHGQFRFNYHHPHIEPGQENEFLLRAFRRDFEMNGPSVMRMARSLMNGWMKYKNHPEARIRKRFARDIEKIPTIYAGSLWATRKWFKDNSRIVERMTDTLDSIYHEFGLKSRIAAPIVGLIVLYFLRKEEKRLATNYPYEPPTFYETSVMAVRPREKTVLQSETNFSMATPAP